MQIGFDFSFGRGQSIPLLPVPVQGPAMRSHPELWQRLVDWRQGSGEAFVLQLEQKLKLKPGNAHRLADEYIRFLALAVTTDSVSAPSTIIDEAWHLHLLDSRTYFERFCPTVLGRTIHHAPNRPAPDRDWAYNETKARYLAAFGTPPPPDIWPDAAGFRRLRYAGAATAVVVAFFLAAGVMHLNDERTLSLWFLAAAILATGLANLWSKTLPMHKGENKKASDADGDGCGGD